MTKRPPSDPAQPQTDSHHTADRSLQAIPRQALRRGDQKGHLLDKRDREHQRPLPARCPGPRTLPLRPGRAEVPVSGHPVTGPDRERQGTMGDEVETRSERVRHHLRRPDPPGRELTMDQIRSTVYLTDPDRHERTRARGLVPWDWWTALLRASGSYDSSWVLMSATQTMVPVKMLRTALRRHRCTATVAATPINWGRPWPGPR